MRVLQVEGIIIKRRNVGEADRILTVFTQELGKLQIKAVGVRKIASKRSPHVELLNIAQLSLYQGKSMPLLTEALAKETFATLKSKLTHIGFAYHICELVDGLCPEGQENREVFDLLKKVLTQLESTEELSLVVHDFEVALLQSLGYWSSQEKLHEINLSYLIEQILEKKLKTRKLLHLLS